MKRFDTVGLEVTCNPFALSHWERVIMSFLGHGADTDDLLTETLRRSPEFALGWAAKGFLHLLSGRGSLIIDARFCLEKAIQAADRTGATARERRYIEALGNYVDGRMWAAADQLAEIIQRYSDDMLAVKLEHSIRAILGDSKGMLVRIRTTLASLNADHPHLGYALGCEAFACAENRLYRQAEQRGRAGLQLVPTDAWGLHAVAIVYDLTAQSRTGVDWLETRQRHWAHCGCFGDRLWSHLALLHLDLGNFEQALELYDTRINADHSDITSGASLLARLEIEGVDLGHRWEELADRAKAQIADGAVIFADLQYLLALQGAQRGTEAQTLIDRLSHDARRSGHDMYEVAGLIGLPIARGVSAFYSGRYNESFEALRRARALLSLAGGSRVQRDVFLWIMIEAGIRAGRSEATEAELVLRSEQRGAADGFTARRRSVLSRLRVRELAAE